MAWLKPSEVPLFREKIYKTQIYMLVKHIFERYILLWCKVLGKDYHPCKCEIFKVVDLNRTYF